MARTKLRHRIPVSIRHYWKLIAGSAALVLALATVIGSVRVSALVASDAHEGFTVNWDIEGTQDLFDTAVPHEIDLGFTQADYDDMVAIYMDTGEKEWIKTDITIDGTTVADVGIRLKGNSTLASLGGGGDSALGGMDMEMPAGMEGMLGGEGGPMGASLSFDEPEMLPWLVDFSKFIDGQVYQGHRQISLRADSWLGGSALSEPVGAEMVEASGQPSYDWTYSTVTVNGSEAVTRRVADIMDATWTADRFGENAGVLYKARAGGSFTYQGDDPAAYEDDFKQINMEGSADLQPILDFLEWMDGADDAAFDAELAEWVDVESFASYAALQNLIVNADDMAGPGSNYYLWYDYGTGLFSVLTWDLDFVLSSADLGPDETPSIMDTMAGLMGGGEGGMAMPEGMEFPEGMAMPEGMGMEGLMGGHPLKERFLASDAFAEVYMEAYRGMYDSIYTSGAALAAVDEAAAAAELNGLDAAESAASLKAVVQERTEYLAASLTGGE